MPIILLRLLYAQNAGDKSAKAYYPKIVPCLSSASGDMATSKSIPQNFAYAESDELKIIYWVRLSSYYTCSIRSSIDLSLVHTPKSGRTKKGNAASEQGGCLWGLMGYLETLPYGEPIPGKNHRIEYVCDSGGGEGANAAAQLH